jgi:hypothetical protein
MITANLEVHQRGDGSWNWVLIASPDVMKPSIVLWDSSPHASARAAMLEGDRVVRGWQIGSRLPWL